MPEPRRLVAFLLFASGVGLVCAGLTTALGPSPSAILASVAAIVSLLYAGATWFGAAPPPDDRPGARLIVFDREGRVVSGGEIGTPVARRFPEMLQPEIERRCSAALAGVAARFPCVQNGRMVLFEAVPVRAADQSILYGMLLVTEGEAAAAGQP